MLISFLISETASQFGPSQILWLAVVFLEACLIAFLFRMHTKTVYSITKTFDSRERELLDRLMYVTNKPWNMPPRVESPEAKEETEPPEENWKDF